MHATNMKQQTLDFEGQVRPKYHQIQLKNKEPYPTIKERKIHDAFSSVSTEPLVD